MPTINCTKCSNPNDVEANFCSECGVELGFSAPTSDRRNKFIFIVITILFASALYWYILNILSEMTEYAIYDTAFYASRLIELMTMSTAVFLVLAMKKSSLKVVGLVFAIIYLIIRLYWFIDYLIEHFSVDEFEYLNF
ncbi:MAG: zinc ribbon domain-containing protein [Crocinitomicaceae bacterium]|nr:zinc ribbon domain-containing protein [Crocinitomicaceae bacterium]